MTGREQERIMEEMRLNKYLSDSGVCSRREADRLVEEGQVLVDGVPAVMGMKVTGEEEIICRGVKVSGRKKERKILLAVNKPRGIVCTTSDKDRAENIVEFLGYPVRVYPIGRLDKDSSGLILMTNQGDIVNKILRGSNRHEKEYTVRVNKPITGEFLDRMRKGVEILDTVTRPCFVEKTGGYTFRIILTQGLNRQIRRMCDALGYRVVALKRVRIMNICLGDLPVGQYREVTAEEWKELERLLEGSENGPGGFGENLKEAGDRENGKQGAPERKPERKPAGVWRKTGGDTGKQKEQKPAEKRVYRTPVRRYEARENGERDRDRQDER